MIDHAVVVLEIAQTALLVAVCIQLERHRRLALHVHQWTIAHGHAASGVPLAADGRPLFSVKPGSRQQ